MANPNKMKTRKVLDMCEHGFWIVVIKNYSDLETPYWIYRKTFGSKRLLVKVSDMCQVTHFLDRSYIYGMDQTPLEEYIEWAKRKDWRFI